MARGEVNPGQATTVDAGKPHGFDFAFDAELPLGFSQAGNTDAFSIAGADSPAMVSALDRIAMDRSVAEGKAAMGAAVNQGAGPIEPGENNRYLGNFGFKQPIFLDRFGASNGIPGAF